MLHEKMGAPSADSVLPGEGRAAKCHKEAILTTFSSNVATKISEVNTLNTHR